MNRENAIITLTNTASLLRDGTRYMKPEHEKQFREAYEMAIKALEQPEIIRCNDCMHNGSFDTDCPIDWAGKDYCNFAERRTDE